MITLKVTQLKKKLQKVEDFEHQSRVMTPSSLTDFTARLKIPVGRN